ncbi:MAG: hypothetical protein WC975_04340 [Phycisphaerae bacterium]
MTITKRNIAPHKGILMGLFVAGASAVVGCSHPKSHVMIEGEDRVSLPNREVRVTAKVQKSNIFFKVIEQQPIDITLTSAPAPTQLRLIKNGRTDEEGDAFAELVPQREGLYEVTARFLGNARNLPGEDKIIVLVVDPKKPVLVLDVDNTLKVPQLSTRGRKLKISW